MTFPCRELTGTARHDSKARNQYLGIQTAATDTKPRTGVESATTTNISDSSESHGNEGQDVAPLIAGRCLHGAKNNRDVKDAHFCRIRRSAAVA